MPRWDTRTRTANRGHAQAIATQIARAASAGTSGTNLAKSARPFAAAVGRVARAGGGIAFAESGHAKLSGQTRPATTAVLDVIGVGNRVADASTADTHLSHAASGQTGAAARISRQRRVT